MMIQFWIFWQTLSLNDKEILSEHTVTFITFIQINFCVIVALDINKIFIQSRS